MTAKRKNIVNVSRLLLVPLTLLVSAAVIVISIYIDCNFSKSYYYLHTSFLVLLVAEFLFLFSYTFWITAQLHYQAVYKNLTKRFSASPITNDKTIETRKASFYASSYSRLIVFTFFILIFTIASLGAGISIINLSLQSAHNHIQSGNNNNNDLAFFAKSYTYILAFVPLILVSQFLKGTLLAIDIATIFISFLKEQFANERASASDSNTARYTFNNDLKNDNGTTRHEYAPTITTSFLSNFANDASKASSDKPDNTKNSNLTTPKNNIRSSSLSDYASAATQANSQGAGAGGGGAPKTDPRSSRQSNIEEPEVYYDENNNIRKTLVKTTMSEHRLTLHSANMTPPLSAHSMSNFAFSDNSKTLKSYENDDDVLPRSCLTAVPFLVNNGSAAAAESDNSFKSGESSRRSLVAGPRSRSALGMRSSKKQLSPIREPDRKANLAESPVFKKNNNAVARTILLPEDRSFEEFSKSPNKEKYKDLNGLLLDNFYKDFNSILPADNDKRKSSPASSQKITHHTLDAKNEQQQQQQHISSSSSSSSSSSNNNSDSKDYNSGINSSIEQEDIARYKRTLVKNQKGLRVSVSSVPKNKVPILGSPPPSQVNSPTESHFFSGDSGGRLDKNQELKPLNLARHLTKGRQESIGSSPSETLYRLTLGNNINSNDNAKKTSQQMSLSVRSKENRHHNESTKKSKTSSVDSALTDDVSLKSQSSPKQCPKNVESEVVYDSPMSWDSNFDPLYENDLQDIPSIPTNTLRPFSRSSVSPTTGKFSPIRVSSSPAQLHNNSIGEDTKPAEAKTSDRNLRSGNRKGLRHISLEEWSANSKQWIKIKDSRELVPEEEQEITLGNQTTPSPVSNIVENVLDLQVLDLQVLDLQVLDLQLLDLQEPATIGSKRIINAAKTHNADDSFTFENPRQLIGEQQAVQAVQAVQADQLPATVQAAALFDDFETRSTKFRFPGHEPKALSMSANFFDQEQKDRANRKKSVKRKYRSRSYSPTKKDSAVKFSTTSSVSTNQPAEPEPEISSTPRNPLRNVPLLSYSKADINVLNNIHGAKRKSLLKSNYSEPSSPKRKNGGRSRSPLKRLSTTFHEPKRSTVVFDDDFNFELEKELVAHDSHFANGENNDDMIFPVSAGFGNASDGLNFGGNQDFAQGNLNLNVNANAGLESASTPMLQPPSPTSTKARSESPKRKVGKNFSINSLKSMLSQIHNRSTSYTPEFGKPNNVDYVDSQQQQSHNHHKRFASLGYRKSLPLFSAKNGSGNVHKDQVKFEPSDFISQPWTWTFNAANTQTNGFGFNGNEADNYADSLIRDVIQHEADYDKLSQKLDNSKDNSAVTELMNRSLINNNSNVIVGGDGGDKKLIEMRSRKGSHNATAATTATTATTKKSMMNSQEQLHSFNSGANFLTEEDSFIFSENSGASTVPSGYIGEYDKERWNTIKTLKNQAK